MSLLVQSQGLFAVPRVQSFSKVVWVPCHNQERDRKEKCDCGLSPVPATVPDRAMRHGKNQSSWIVSIALEGYHRWSWQTYKAIP
jgi:hypothetical protein